MSGVDDRSGGGPVYLPNSPAQRERLRGIARDGQVGVWAHCVTAALDIRGPAHPAALQAGVDDVLRRRPALRAVFRTDRDTHRIAGTAATAVHRIAVDGTTPDERWAEAHRLAREWAHRPIPIDRPPLLRATVFDTGERHLFLLMVDQLACDAWSANLVVADVVAAAARAAEGRPLAPVLSDGYEQARRAREAWTDGPSGREAIARRRAALAGSSLRWPLTGIPPRQPGEEPAEATEHLGAEAVAPFLARVRGTGGSVFSAVTLASMRALLAPADRVVLTSTFACRTSKLEETVVGWFANEVAIPLPELTGTIAEHLRALRGRLVEALNDQLAPYPLVRPGSAPPGARVSLLYLPAQVSGAEQVAMRIGAATVDRCRVTLCPTGADVDLYVVEGPLTAPGGVPAVLTIGAMSGPVGPDRAALAALVARWRDAILHLGRLDWQTEPLWPPAAEPVTHAVPGGPRRPRPDGANDEQ
jgi:hypothetical protein